MSVLKTEKVILDVDPGIDDSLAIMLALKTRELDVLGITSVSGNVEATQAAINARKIVEFCGEKQIPVFKGRSMPIKRELTTAQDTHGEDGLGESNLSAPEKSYKEGGVDYLLETIKKHPGEITVIALGPLTNIATALKQDKDVFNKLKNLIIMGGSAKSHGNCSQVAEYNFWADPHAADYVFKNIKKPLTMVGLDVTRKIVLTPNIRELFRQFNTPLSRLVNKITRFYVDFHWKQERTLGCVINDPLAVAVSFMPEIVESRSYYVEVETEGRSIGQSLVDFGGFYGREPNAHVCLKVDHLRFMKKFMKTICPGYKNDIENYFASDYKIDITV